MGLFKVTISSDIYMLTCSMVFCLVDRLSTSDYGGFVMHEPQPYVPSNPIHENDIERLLSIESESSKGWSKVKHTKEAEVWRREASEVDQPCITKVHRVGGFWITVALIHAHYQHK